jgi:hypothetical protein
MDEIVKAALAKWPDVPACYGWLGLDARGEWYLRDERVQAAGPFPQVKGSRITHDKLRAFIARNYECDAASGGWFFQNGPQRVYAELEAAPWVWRLGTADGAAPRLESHTGRAATYRAALLDEAGRLFVASDIGLGLVHTLDMEAASEAVASGAWRVEDVRFESLPARYAYAPSPAALQRAARAT